MSINRQEFNQQCIDFVEKFSCDQWSIRIPEHESFAESELADARLMLAKSEIRVLHPNQLRTYEYNVIYSESFEVPVMYFSVSQQGGSPVPLETILSLEEGFKGDLNQIVSQVEHPLLFRPFNMIHPCKTRDFMAQINSRNYLITWLSTIGTLIGLKLDQNLASLDETYSKDQQI